MRRTDHNHTHRFDPEGCSTLVGRKRPRTPTRPAIPELLRLRGSDGVRRSDTHAGHSPQTDHHTTTRLGLDEDILTLEATLVSLRQRKQQVDEALHAKCQERRKERDNTAQLEARLAELQELQAHQQELCQRLTRTLAEMEEALSKRAVEAGLNMTVRDIVELLEEEHEDEDDNKTPETSGTHETCHERRKETMAHDDSGDKEGLETQETFPSDGCTGQKQRNDGATLDGPLESFLMRSADGNALMTLRRFWHIQHRSHRQNGFFPCMPPRAVRKVLDQAATEKSGLQYAALGQLRRHGLCYTCLDARHRGGNAHDCLATGMHHETERVFDPTVTLCPYEFGGECMDRFCPYQHTHPRALGTILPRELLPLPPMHSLVPRDGATANVDVHGGSSPSNMPEGHRLTVRPQSTLNDAPTDTATFREQEFVALPPPESTGGGDDDEASNKGTEGSPRTTVSFTVMARSIIDRRSHRRSESMAEVCESVADVVDFARIAIHAGRFDLCENIGSVCRRRMHRISFTDDEALHSVDQIFEPLVTMVVRSIESSFAYNSQDGQGIFGIEFESQQKLAYLSTALRILSKQSLSSTEIAGQMNKCITKLDGLVFSPKTANGSMPGLWGDLLDGLGESDVMKVSVEVLSLFANMSQACEEDTTSQVVKWADSVSDVWNHVLIITKRGQSLNDDLPSLARSCLVGQMACILFQLVEMAARSFSPGDPSFPEIHDRIHKIIMSILVASSELAFFDLVSAPVVAVSIALSCASRQYRQAHQRLEVCLIGAKTKRFGHLHLSELLWSQMIQMRVAFPVLSEAQMESFHECNRLLVDQLELAGVYVHRLALRGDWHIVECLTEQGSHGLDYEKTWRDIICRVYGFQCASDSLEIVMDGCAFRPRCGRGLAEHRIPRSINLAGEHITRLSLNRCEIRSLDDDFVDSFPLIRSLLLNHNEITMLPANLHKLNCLQELQLSSNQLSHLPDNMAFEHLEKLHLSNNQLTSLPASMKSCQNLQELLLDGNSLDDTFLDVVLVLPNLLVLVQPQLKMAKSP